MTPELLFQLANVFVLPGWMLLLVAPNARWTHRLVHSGGMSLLLAAAYLALLALRFRAPLSAFATLGGVAGLFANPWLLVTGWIHYLCFDLWIGSWITREGYARRMPRYRLVPCIVLTWVFGPVGLLAFMALRPKNDRP